MPPTRRILPLLLALLPTSPAVAGLQEEIELAIRGAGMEGVAIAVSVRDAGSGAELVELNDQRLLMPASNMKLLTSGAALHVLGETFVFRTRLLLNGRRLLIVGDGDPALGDPELLPLMKVGQRDGLDVEAFLDLWIEPALAAGIKHLDEIVADDRIFDRHFVHETWPADQLHRWYCAEVAGLNFHLNVLHFYPRPGGQRPIITDIRPRVPWLSPVNRGTCDKGPEDESSAWIARKPDSNQMTVCGNVKFTYRKPVEVTVHDPPAFLARLLADRLRAAGVQVDHARSVRPDEPASVGAQLGPAITTPISTIVTRSNRDSENLYAEALLKRMGQHATGRPGSWLNGTAILRHVVHERLGPDHTARIIVADGSGLSRRNRVAAEAMTAWLNSFDDDPALGPVFIRSLAPAHGEGRLARRFQSTDLHGMEVLAKTGYISKVSCLSGYVTAPDARRRSFSILVNGFDASARPAKAIQDRIVSLIAEDMARVEVTLGSD